MKFFSIALASTAALVAGHHDPVPPAHEVQARAASGARCANHVSKRYESMHKRGAGIFSELLGKSDTDTFFHTIQNTTCVLAPTVTEGPYWISGEQVRNNITEDQQGKPLVLDIGIMDVNTCEPLPNAYIDVWHANATGYYSGFEDFTLDMPSKRQMNDPTSNNTYLRGIAKTNEEGIVEFQTIFGGYYTGRTPHFHLKAFIDAEESEDGSITGGEQAFTGQIFFSDEIANQTFAEYPYTENENSRSYNADDTILTSEQENGNNPIVDLQDIDGTLYGIITVGINATATGQTGENSVSIQQIKSSTNEIKIPMDKEQEPVATTPHLNAYYSLLIIAAVGHLGLLLFTLASQRLHKHGVLINFYLIFAVTLWFDSILCWTHHMHDPDPPTAIQIVNATFRLSGMVMNSATTLMCVVKFWVSTNIAASTKISKHLHFLDNVTLVIFPYAVGMPFFFAYLGVFLKDRNMVHRTPYYADCRHQPLNIAATIVALIIMIGVVTLAIWLAIILIRLRASQRGLVQIHWTVNLQLTARILLFLFYSLTSITLHVWGLYGTDGVNTSSTLVFASTGLVAFTLFLIQADILAALSHYFGFTRRDKLGETTNVEFSSTNNSRRASLNTLNTFFPQSPPPVHKHDKKYSLLDSESVAGAHALAHTAHTPSHTPTDSLKQIKAPVRGIFALNNTSFVNVINPNLWVLFATSNTKMGVYPIVSKLDLEHMVGVYAFTRPFLPVTPQLINEKPVVVEVTESDKPTATFESISNENEENSIFNKYSELSEMLGASTSTPAYFSFQKGEKKDSIHTPSDAQLKDFISKAIAEIVIEEMVIEVILRVEAMLAARAAIPFLHSVVAYQLIVREVHAAGVAEVRCV
ncbi:hypothetical protein E3P99_03043 [Wallemia hederae]|uniref:Uncharacterized protein n=1 Tax=Wallemia hederae TaxID=1540922 RepID=A0A4T0FHG2_9BASI|nr:hypothetical protein E3P99_03043 [Wallemia hederae]